VEAPEHRIWKYVIPFEGGPQEIEIPKWSWVIEAAYQNREPCIWVVVNPAVDKEVRRFHWRGTGHPFPATFKHVGTFHDPPGFVWHLLEDIGEDGTMTRTKVDVSHPDTEDFTALTENLTWARDRLAQKQAAFEDVARIEREELDAAQKMEKAARDALFAAMEGAKVDTVKGRDFTASVTQRHDYIIEDDDALWEALANPEHFRQWNLRMVKSLGSKHRKEHGKDFPGITSVPVRFLTVRGKGE